MKILILGAGQVGGSLAEHLAGEANNITVVDTDQQRLRTLHARLDIQTLQGHGAHPSTLSQAGCESADMLIAVTNNDEINMVACQVAYSLFRTPTRIARVRSGAYLTYRELFRDENIPIDVLISPEQLVTTHIRRLIEYPGALQVIDFADGLAQLVAVKAYRGGPMIGKPLRQLHELAGGLDSRVTAIYRNDHPFIPTGDTLIQDNDELFFIAAHQDIRSVMGRMRHADRNVRHVIIAGGGRIGERLALTLEATHRVKIIEQLDERCHFLAERLDSTVILHGSATDKQLLTDENIDECDIYCALTNDDEVNIMSCMLAKQLGARKVLALINNGAYVDLVQGGVIDIAISPAQSTINGLLAHVRQGDTVNVHSLRRGAAEAVEIVAHGDAHTSLVVGRSIDDIDWPPDVTVGAIVRNGEVLISTGELHIEHDDHVILLMIDKRRMSAVEHLFRERQRGWLS
ncbi:MULTISPECIES: Trk system potassium transporter TrkA [unclassified Zymobacter]|uniref:Trk system potassium transporter TrkA n=1 Tax=unclassified Zymobacter TaxID=3048685 RepID=UPI0039C27050